MCLPLCMYMHNLYWWIQHKLIHIAVSEMWLPPLICIILLQVIWNRLYHAESFCDKGTLKHLENVIRLTNVPKKVKDNVSAAQDFYSLVTDAHIVSAALHHFSMPSLDAEPTGIAVPMNPNTLIDFMKQTVGELVNKFAMNFMETQQVSNPPPLPHRMLLRHETNKIMYSTMRHK